MAKDAKISSRDTNSCRQISRASRYFIENQPNCIQCPDASNLHEVDLSDSESLYCNAPIYSSNTSLKSSQIQQKSLNDATWFNNRFIRIVFPDCSEEFISSSQKAPIGFFIDNLLRDKGFNFSSFKIFSIQSNEVRNCQTFVLMILTIIRLFSPLILIKTYRPLLSLMSELIRESTFHYIFLKDIS